MTSEFWRGLVAKMRGVPYQFGVITVESPVYRVDFAEGLSDSEVASIESRYAFRFPPDLRSFLQVALPSGPLFPDWRSGDESHLRDWLSTPEHGIRFDVEHNNFWLQEWGPRPHSLDEALRHVSQLVSRAPKLIPVFSHRMIPEEPLLPGNPVYSVHQTDIIVYGHHLADYFSHEFGLEGSRWPFQSRRVRPIRFWSALTGV